MILIDKIVENFWGISAAILTILFVASIRYREHLKKKKLEAAERFRSKVLEALKGLFVSTGDIKWPDGNSFNIESELSKRYADLSNAVSEYLPYVHSKNQFLRDWNKYRGSDTAWDGNDQDYFQYSGHKIDGQPAIAGEVIFFQNVTKLLRHAKT